MTGPQLVALVVGVSIYVGIGLVTVLEMHRRGGFKEVAGTNNDAAALATILFFFWPFGLIVAGWFALGKWARS